jgi:hypothetical protein
MKIDTVICVLGWEDRFLGGMEIIFQKNDVKNLILISFEDYASMGEAEQHREILKKSAEEKNVRVIPIQLVYSDSIGNWKILDNFFMENSLGEEVLVNITTFPRETIWTLLFFLKKVVSHVNYIYFKPIDYNKSWLTKNHKHPRLLFKHSGVFDLNKKLVLFIITGFDNNRLETIVEFYEPEEVVMFFQEGNQFDNQLRNIGIINGKNIKVEKVSLNNYDIDGSTEIIQKYVEKYASFNIIVSSQGPKTSALSTYKNYLLSEQNIGLAYVPAKDFNISYSKGTDPNAVEGVLFF